MSDSVFKYSIMLQSGRGNLAGVSLGNRVARLACLFFNTLSKNTSNTLSKSTVFRTQWSCGGSSKIHARRILTAGHAPSQQRLAAGLLWDQIRTFQENVLS